MPLPTTPADKKLVVGAGVAAPAPVAGDNGADVVGPTILTTGLELGEGVAVTDAGTSVGAEPAGVRVGKCVGPNGAGVTGKGVGPIGAGAKEGAGVLGVKVVEGVGSIGVCVGDGDGPTAPGARVGGGDGTKLVGVKVGEGVGPPPPTGDAMGEAVGGGVPVR